MKPAVKIRYEYSCTISIAGINSEKNVDASIIPAALLIINEKVFAFTFLYMKTSEAPSAVISHVKPVPMSASCQPVKLLIQSI